MAGRSVVNFAKLEASGVCVGASSVECLMCVAVCVGEIIIEARYSYTQAPMALHMLHFMWCDACSYL